MKHKSDKRKMIHLGKNGKNGKFGKASRGKPRRRKRYIEQSKQFINWVNQLGFEQSVFGMWIDRLDQKLKLRQHGLLFLFCLLLSFLLFGNLDFPIKVQVGEIAQTEIKSPIEFELVDQIATESKRIEAENAVTPLFDFDPESYDSIYKRIYHSFRMMREQLQEFPWARSTHLKEKEINQFFDKKEEFVKAIGTEISDINFVWLLRNRFGTKIENLLVDVIGNWSSDKIVDWSAVKLPDGVDRISVREVLGDKVGNEELIERDMVKHIKNRHDFTLDKVNGVEKMAHSSQRKLLQVARNFLTPNITFNRQETEERKSKARLSVHPVQISIKKNQSIINTGSMVLPIHITLLNEIQRLKSDQRTDVIALVASLLFVVLIIILFAFLRRFRPLKNGLPVKDVAAMGVVVFLVVAITKIFLFMTEAAFVSKYGSMIPESVFLYLAPLASGAMLVGLLIGAGEVVWLFTTFVAIVLAAMVDMKFSVFMVSLIGGVTAARGVYACKSRNDVYWTGIWTGLVNMIVIGLILTLEHWGRGDLIHQLVWNLPAGFFGGVFSAMVAMAFVPILESTFNYTTDVKLLELSNLSHPLMQEMIMKAPGTYHHSISVGTMVDKAASDIGANALLAKIMAYYHDIGKMEHSQYFIENQRPGYNPHDHLSPHLSKTVLIAHVKDGAELGYKHKLGQPIIDGILQHHGTTLISFFYNKALNEQNEDLDHVSESEFRYPGPKPQFKEAALVMLADSIEAAARSMEEPTSVRLQNLVRNIIQGKFIDGQLDECDLTLKDLSVIESCFKRTLLGIYHQRLEYPHMKDGKLISVPRPAKKSGSKKGFTSA